MKKQATYKINIEKILDLMAEKNINRAKLADHLNVNDRTVRNWINLGKEVQFHNIINMGKVLEVQWTELLYDACGRNNLLENVRKICIEDMLEQSKKNLPYQMELSIEKQFDLIKPLWKDGFSQSKTDDWWTNKSIDKVFKTSDQAMLIHGLEGSGKTTILLELMEILLAEAKKDYDAPIPVLFYLPSWSIERSLIENWLLTELNKVYEVPYHAGKNMLENGRILPLFEDLDRVSLNYRPACIDAINFYREKQVKKYGSVPMVVCSRTAHLKEIKPRLHLRGEIVVKSPAQNEVEKFLHAAGDGFPKFLNIKKPDETYKNVPKTPFLLATIFQAYNVTNQKQKANSLESINMEAIRLYVNAMLRDTECTRDYAYLDAMNWLSCLAQQLRKNNHGIFYIERIKPNYLPQRLGQMATLVPMMLSGLSFGILFGWGFQVAFDENHAFIIGGLVGFVLSSALWMIGIGHEIQPVETFSWAWSDIRRNAIDRLLVTLLLLVIFTLFGAIFGNVRFGIIMALLVSIGFFLFYELPERKVEKIRRANEGIKRALICCICTGLFTVVIMTISLSLISDSSMVFPFVAALGLSIGLLNGGHFCIQHLFLRSILWYKNYAPWNFISFLNYSVKCSLMYKVGGGYKFRHGLFMDFFAELDSKDY
jgi:transcriptional regulator with XRE-family HTH domain